MGKFGDFIRSSTGGGIIGAGLGLLLQGNNDRRQLIQQQKLNEQQLSADAVRMGMETERQKEMWKATSFPAQIEQIKIAGLNPALVYGMGGSGGATVGSSPGSVSGPQAPAGGGEVGMAMQLAQLSVIS